MKDSIRESKYKVGDTVKVAYVAETFTITEVVYDLEKHSPDTHMYVVTNAANFGLWFESELTLCNSGVQA
jgi:hypothetical protein